MASTVNITAVQNGTVVSDAARPSESHKQAARLKAVRGGKYVLSDIEKGLAPPDIIIKRVGKDLHVGLEDDFSWPDLVIEGFFEYGGRLFGLAADGEYHEFLSITPGEDMEAAFLPNGQSSKLELDSRALIGFEDGGLSKNSAIDFNSPSLLMPGLLGLGIAGAVLAVSNDKNEHSSQAGGLDTSVPTGKASIDRVEDSVGSQVGDVEAGGVTDDKTPSFSGTGTPGSTVVIIDNGKNIGQVLVGADGSWVFVVTQPLAEGVHTIVVAEKGKNGNLGELSQAFGFIVDTVAPGKPTIDSVIDDAGETLVPDNGSTKNDRPTLSGKGEVGALIEIYANGEKLGETHVDSDGTWSFTPDQGIGDGEYVLTAVATDVAGNVGLPSDSFTITIETTAPAPSTIDAVIDHQGNSPSNVLSGGAADNEQPNFKNMNGIHHFADADMRQAFDISLDKKSVNFTVGVTSMVVKPIISHVNNGSGVGGSEVALGGVTNNTRPSISGTGPANSWITLYSDGVEIGQVWAGAGGVWSITPNYPLAEGHHDLTVTATDGKGNVSDPSDAFSFTLDTTPVKDAQWELSLENGTITAERSPTFSGKTEANSTVIIYNKGVEFARVAVDEKGNWTFTPDSELADGKYSFTTAVVDQAGNIGPKSDAIGFAVNGDSVPVITHVSGSAGEVAQDGITNSPHPVLSGTGPANSWIALYSNGVEIGQAWAGSNGVWSITVQHPLAEGHNDITVVATDGMGNVSAPSDAFSLTLDTTPPSDSQWEASLENGAITAERLPTFSGKAEANSTVIIYNKGVEFARVAVDEKGNWTFTPDSELADGKYSFTTAVVDQAGNIGPKSDAIGFAVNGASVPAITHVSGSAGEVAQDGITNTPHPVLSGTGPANSWIAVYSNGVEIGQAWAGSNGVWSITVQHPLAEGHNDITVVATDGMGNVSAPSDAFSLTLDTTPPSDSQWEASLENGTITAERSPTFSGKTEANSTVILYNKGVEFARVAVDEKGNWTFTPNSPLVDGQYSFTMVVVDQAGNTGPKSDAIGFAVSDTPAPTITNVSSAAGDVALDGVTNGTRPTLSGTGKANSWITLYNDGVEIGKTWAGVGGVWSFTPSSPLAEGDYSITVVATDGLGNVSTPSDVFSFTLDTTPPSDSQWELSLENGAITAERLPTFSGKAEANSTVIIYNKGVEFARVTVDDQGNWTFTPDLPLVDGQYSFTTVVVDQAGNTSPESDAIGFTVDGSTAIDKPVISEVRDDSGASEVGLDGFTNNPRPVISGTAEAGAIVTLYNHGQVIGTVKADANGQWSFTPTADLVEGQNSLTATATDDAGNISAPSGDYSFTVDTIPPSDSQWQMSVEDGDVTADRLPAFSGQTEPNSTVIIYNNGVEFGRVTVDAQGNWMFTPDSPLVDGQYDFTTVVVDQAGNVGPESDSIGFTVEPAPVPEKPVIDDITYDFGGSGSVPDGALIRDNTPTLQGSNLRPGDTVHIYDGKNRIGTATVAEDGSWSFTPKPLADADHSFSIVVEGSDGERSEPSDSWAVSINTVLPDIIISEIGKTTGAPGQHITDDGSAGRLVQGIYISPLAVGERIEVSTDGGITWSEAVISDDMRWSFVDTAEHASSWSVQARVIDAAGNSKTATEYVSLHEADVKGPESVVVEGSEVTVSFDPDAKLAAGDTLVVLVGKFRLSHMLTSDEVAAGKVVIATDALDLGLNVSAYVIDKVGNASDIRHAAFNVIEDFSLFSGLAVGDSREFPAFVLTNISGGVVDGLGSLTLGGATQENSIVSLDLTSVASSIAFSLANVDTSENLVRIYDAAGELISVQSIGKGAESFSYDAPPGILIGKVEIETAAGEGQVVIDDFALSRDEGMTVPQSNTQVITGFGPYHGTDADDVFLIENVDLISLITPVDGHAGLDTLKLTGSGQVLDMTVAGAALSSLEIIDITGAGDNTLKLSLNDVLNQGAVDLFHESGLVQMMIKGDVGDVVDLQGLLNFNDPGEWGALGQVTVAGTVYDVYQHSGLGAELLVQNGVELHLS
ncbi:Ig-like domain-containing protein [Pseudomonas sp. P9_32]|uniref:Ig-like domain-containing protein n=2 Tax=unclassified Pseudomonas TaxID=196821 RepID=UPI002A35BE4C|nr:Ig-like domain-containing protein [Pseudomonas sp. P9_32]WPN65636.1 Ig-like domain-containing protein [Pseudomonas sp. P9_32]